MNLTLRVSGIEPLVESAITESCVLYDSAQDVSLMMGGWVGG